MQFSACTLNSGVSTGGGVGVAVDGGDMGAGLSSGRAVFWRIICTICM